MLTLAVRGAVQISQDQPELISDGVFRMVSGILDLNHLLIEDLVAIHFTVTKDLVSLNPATGLRKSGYVDVPLFCSQEPEYAGGLERCVRVLVFFAAKEKYSPAPLYLDGAEKIRPDLYPRILKEE